MDDKELLGLLRSDPDEGMKRLLDGYTGCVYSVVRAVLSGVCDSSEIEDVVADTFLSFYTRLDAFRGESSIKTYLCRTAKHLANNCLRKRREARSLDDEDLFFELADDYDLANEVVKKQLVSEILAEIKRMEKPDGEILFRKYYLGQSTRQIAKDLRLSVENVDTRTHRAIARLKNKFGG